MFHKNIDKYLEHSQEYKDKIKNFDSQHQNIKIDKYSTLNHKINKISNT